MDEIEVVCTHCEAGFRVPGTMKGGMVNCPHCGGLVRIRSGPEPLYWIAVLGGGLLALAFCGLLMLTMGPTTAGVFAVLVVLGVLAWSLSF